MLNRAKQATNGGAPGAGNFGLGGPAVVPFQTFADAGASNGTDVPYLLEDGAAWEIGFGRIGGSGQLIRNFPSGGQTITASSNGGNVISASADAMVSAVMRAEDIPFPTLAALIDVNVTEGAGINGYTLNWNSASSKWIAVAPLVMPTNASFNFHTLSDVNVTEGSTINGYTIGWDNSTSKWLAVWSRNVAKPPTSTFGTTKLLGSATISQTLNAGKSLSINRTDGGNASTDMMAEAGQTVPSGSTWSVTARLRLKFLGGANSLRVGLMVANPSTGYGVNLYWNAATNNLTSAYYTGAHTFGSTTQLGINGLLPDWWSITYSSGTFQFYFSYDGATWLACGSITTSTFTGFSSSSIVGVMLFTSNTTIVGMGVDILNWLVTANATPGG